MPEMPFNVRFLIDKDNETLGWVELLDVMPHPKSGIHPDLAIVNAARVSYMGESKGVESDIKLLEYLFKHFHSSPFEMVELKFRICAPLMVFAQMVRHRTASLNSQSSRYTEVDETKMYHPQVWRLQSKSNKQGSDGVLSDEKERDILDALYSHTNIAFDDAVMSRWSSLGDMVVTHYENSFALYQTLLKAGIAKEQARVVLPANAQLNTWVWKMDAHNLMHFLRLRQADEAQLEIRLLANRIYDIFKCVMPYTAALYDKYQPTWSVHND